MRWQIPRELLWAIIFSLSVTVIALWPFKYPYGSAPQAATQHSTQNDMASIEHRRDDDAAEIQVLGIKPGEWLLSIVTLMLWGATVGLVRSADRTAERQLRPYFDLRATSVEDFEVGKRPRVTLGFENVGQTPAIDVTCQMNIQVRDIGNEPPVVDIAGGGSKSTIGPDGSLRSHLTVTEPLSRYSFDAVKNDRAAFFAWGIIRYSDVFGHSRYLRFRMAFTAESLAAGEGSMETCNEGNDAN